MFALRKPVNGRRVVVVSCCVLVAGVAGALFTRTVRTPGERLVDAYRHLAQSPVVARLSCLPHVRATPAAALTSTLSFRAAAEAVLASDAGVNERAAAALLTGRSSSALRLLESASHSRPDDATTFNDLAAVRYEIGRSTHSYQAFLGALAATDRALDLQPAYTAALFNRGLALDAIGFRNDAAAAFRQVLALEPRSGWAEQIRARGLAVDTPTDAEQWIATLPSLEDAAERGDSPAVKRIVLRFPQFARTWAEGEFSARWAEALLAGKQDQAMHWLRVIRIVGATLQQTSGEFIVTEVGQTIEKARPAQARLLADAHLANRRARKAYDGRHVSEGLPRLQDAERRFAAAGSPAAFSAALFIANASFDAHKPDDAARIYDRLVLAVPRRYGALRAQLDWLHSLLTGWSGRPFESVQAARASMDAFERMGEHDNTARMRSTLASLFAALGDDAEARRLHARVFPESIQSGISKSIEIVLNHAARDEMDDRNWESARALLRLQLTRPTINARMAFDVRMSMAFVDAQLTGKPPDFREAAQMAARIPDPSLRADALDELSYGTALQHRDDPAAAVGLLNKVIDYRRSHARLSLLPNPYVQRAHAFVELGNTTAAKADLETAISLVEDSGTPIADPTLRDEYLGITHDAYRDLAELLFNEGRPAEAFSVADRGRGGGVAERLSSSTQTGSGIEALQERLDDEVVVVHYSALGDRLALVIIEHHTWSVAIVHLSRARLEALRDQFVRSIANESADEIRLASAALFRCLIQPLTPKLAGKKRLIVIPDDATSGIPFEALRSPDGPLLVERIAIAFAPNAATAFQPHKDLPGAITVVADPAFDSTVFPNLARLGAARRDADRLRRLFPGANVLAGATATPSAVRQAMLNSSVVHIAAHAFSDTTDASRSFIVLAPDRDGSSGLYSRDIAVLKLTNAPLVVIAGCETGSAGGGSGSVRSLALAFLAAGSSAVVATRWSVDDEASSAITAAFYRSIAAGQAPVDALQSAQLAAMRNGIAARQWAAFQVYTTDGNAREGP